MLEPNTIYVVIASIIFVSLFVLFGNNKINNLDIQISNFFFKRLYYPVFKTVDFIQRVLFVVLPIFILLHPIFAEYPRKITHYVCDNFVECVISSSYPNIIDGDVVGYLQPYKIPNPYNRGKFIKLNAYQLDHDGRRDMIDIENYFKEHPYSF